MNNKMKTIPGELQIDYVRGVVWFNDENGICRLRISKIDKNRLVGKDKPNDPLIDLVAKEIKKP